MPPRRDSKHTVSAGERPQTYVLDRAATGPGDERNLAKEFLETAGETYSQTTG